MIAIPVKTNNENPALSPLFGKAKWFAYVDRDGNISIEKNETQSGRVVVDNMIAKGVDTIVFNHMGANPFMLLQKANMECFYGGDERILLQDLLSNLQNEELVKVDSTNMTQYLEEGKHDHSHDHSHHH
ncbi:NifB/NifX family molybdenum-iron cluster-binding protein [Sulfurimonas microaerophilic]|uniref:NifB/NifX family molybdenum-iron cluster-binding protein n=1 Tax=Sulfurimonas microaerophilic TaxID=3058392 RepID=UPI002714D82C|nr:NifB/NifX family molybdenum-iron cluster-binding protein [Sulfurimonas sp. hsl 1-7]